MRLPTFRLTLTLGMAVAAPLSAQCGIRVRPGPTCPSWFIAEAFAGGGVGGATAGDQLALGGETGWMRRISPETAVGAGVAISNIGVSVRPRYRRWLAPTTTVDVGPGIQWTPGRVERLELNAAVMYRDLVGAWVSGVLDLGYGPTPGLYGGIRTGGEAGLASWGAGLVTFAVLLVLYSHYAD